MNEIRCGDRVQFLHPVPHYFYGWPHNRQGTIMSEPYRDIWYVCVDGYPHSRVPITTEQITSGFVCHWDPNEDHG